MDTTQPPSTTAPTDAPTTATTLPTSDAASGAPGGVVIMRPEDELFKPVPKPPGLEEATATMFQNISAYLRGELTATTEDYKLLESMNILATEKYKEMTDTAGGLTAFMQSLQDKYAAIHPYLLQIDNIDKNVLELEKTVNLLDEYTKRLEAKFKTIDKSQLVRIDTSSPAPAPAASSNPTFTSIPSSTPSPMP
eukprot:TRINITY_DN2140_c0_g1_i3.p1 TRINITY_DN2140_c0_g1~~TRINITY_DN2140_c0_g1_i3.p1  ORF type:complete len:194 (-),score=58.52 TRINITY_DN2140_c0_g1_i3:36-617(-)